MKHLTLIQYSDTEFEISYEMNGQWYEDQYINVDLVDFSIHGLPAELEDHEDAVHAVLMEDYGDILEELKVSAEGDYNDYIHSIVG